eukprot:TRINITY_DN28339_c0_g1_i1.p1 TRINITY_DN28339_c0_g1~~TRINITY_DN28339_c0_g1_i1.p1  ORF type:complete len:253 (+),score=77.45 TRINITY_DN28339_c0_g1_i1:138-896(+)
MIRRPPRSTLSSSSAASDVYKRQNSDWLQEGLNKLKGKYVLFDLPGQVELFTNHDCIMKLARKLEQWGFRLTAVHLVDSHHCAEASKFVAVLLVTLSTMMKLEMPHVNVLSKIDLVESHGRLDFGLEFYTSCLDMEHLAAHIRDDTRMPPAFARLNTVLCETIDMFDYVQFCPLNVSDKHMIASVLKVVDKANGYCFGGLEGENMAALMGVASGQREWRYSQAAEIQDIYLDTELEVTIPSDDDDDDEQSCS